MKRRTFLSALGASLATCAPLVRATPAYPASPVRMIVPYSAGGGADAVARLMAQGMSEALGKSFIVENKPGAGGVLGAQLAAQAQPDGYTVLLGGNPELTITPWIQGNVSYVASRDFTPIVLVSQSPNVLVTRSPFKGDLREALAAAEQSPRGITIATPGNGSPQHIAVEMLKAETGLEIIHVPYKGAGPATIAVLGGEVTFALVGAPPALPHIASDKLVALAVTQTERTPLLPDVPTLGEALAILGNEDLLTWYGLLVPSGTPADVVTTLEGAAFATLEQPGMREKLAVLGTDAIGMRSSPFTQRMKNESDRYQKIVQRLGLANA